MEQAVIIVDKWTLQTDWSSLNKSQTNDVQWLFIAAGGVKVLVTGLQIRLYTV